MTLRNEARCSGAFCRTPIALLDGIVMVLEVSMAFVGVGSFDAVRSVLELLK